MAHATIGANDRVRGRWFFRHRAGGNLLRRATHTPTRLLLIEREHDIGCGLAYENHALHRRLLLSVTVGRMSANSAAPLEFFHFAQRRLPNVTTEDFLPRALYGEYLQEVLLAAELSIHFAYPLMLRTSPAPTIALAVDDLTLAGQILRRKEFRLLGEADLPSKPA